MKTVKYIFFVLLIVVVSDISFAQDDVYYTPKNKQKKEKEEKDFNPQKRKINSGYVFIDGKYVEPPYRFKRKGKKLYFNDLIIREIKPDNYKKNTIVVKESPGVPPWITKMDSIDSYLKEQVPKYNMNYFSAQINYLYSHYKFEEVPELAKEYFMKFPNVKNVTGNTILTVEAYNGDTRNFIVGGKRFDRFSRTFGPDKVKTHKRNGARKFLNERCLMYNEILERGGFFFLITTNVGNDEKRMVRYWFGYEQGIDIIRRFRNLKESKTRSSGGDEYLTDSILNGLFSKAQIDTVLKGIDINILNEEIEDTIKSEKNDNKSKLEIPKNNNINVTPFNKSINMACPDPWAVRYSGDNNYDYTDCFEMLHNQLNSYGYTLANDYIDGTNGDNDFGNFTFENFSNFLNSGISWLETHGDQDGYISLVY
ncbi:MAG: hypothetical protein PHF99_12885, partial [Bacteroidales bacterium]|nr:hypothetical protein [Bacteroidales bacterium]